ncbi:MAG TPA: histidine--tRNA ligase, partial [Candidatus Acidoferrum sp.]
TKREEKPRKFQAIRGTRDLLPPDTALWNRVEQTAHEVFTTFGYGEIRLPIFETTELFARSIGTDTDVVSKEMYTFEDRPSGLPDPKDVPPEDYTAAVEHAMKTGQIPDTAASQSALAVLKHQLEYYAVRQNDLEQSERAYLIWIYAARSLQLGEPLTLRPEATASVCRAYIEHNMQQMPQPVKLYYMGPMFRRERPQKGRYRQFYQIGAEILEASRPDAAKDTAKELAKDAVVDAELIEMLMTFFAKLELRGTQLDINSIGCRDCRPKYVELLRAELTKVKDKLGADSQRRIETNPLRVLDSKLEHEQAIIATLPRIADHLCDDCKAHYAEVKRQLDLRGVAYRENWRLVRGLDYYMRTTFEITATGLGSQNAVCGGGRYDGLVELLGGPPTKGIGFAIGEDRLILSLQESGVGRSAATDKKGAAPQGRDVYIAWMGEKTYATAIRAAKTLRDAGFSVELPPVEQKFGKALERASKLGARHALILGEDEVASGQWTLKTLADGVQQKLTEQALLEYLHRA